MDKEKERRALNRLALPQTIIFLTNRTWFDIFSILLSHIILKRIFKETTLKDISKSGACIITGQHFNWGETITLLVFTPGEKRVRIKGRVRWISLQDDDGSFHIGIQFLAFGKGKMYNSFQCREQLRYFTPQRPILSVK